MAFINPSSSYGFKPSDEDMLSLLDKKINGKPLSNDNDVVLEYDLYGDKNPWEIWEQFKNNSSNAGKDLYFFTTLKKKSLKSTRLLRAIGSGSWEGEDKARGIMKKHTNICIGQKKRFRFEKSGTIHDGCWILHEYTINKDLLANQSVNVNYALCRFRKNEKGNQQTRKQRKEKNMALGLATNTLSANDCPLSEIVENKKDIQQTKTQSESWVQSFAAELIKNQEHLLKEQEICMLPNVFYKELLGLESIQSK